MSGSAVLHAHATYDELGRLHDAWLCKWGPRAWPVLHLHASRVAFSLRLSFNRVYEHGSVCTHTGTCTCTRTRTGTCTHQARTRTHMQLNRKEMVDSTFAACKDPLEKKQLCYLLAKHGYR